MPDNERRQPLSQSFFRKPESQQPVASEPPQAPAAPTRQIPQRSPLPPRPEQTEQRRVVLRPEVYARLREEATRRITDELDASHLQPANRDKPAIREQVEEKIRETMQSLDIAVNRGDREAVVKALFQDMLGLGSLEPLLDDPTITEIMVNAPQEVFVERNGRLERAAVDLGEDTQIYRIIERIVAPLGRRIDETSPMVDARLQDGSRVNAIIPPLSLKGPTLTIRKFSREPITIDDMVRGGSLSTEMATFVEAAVAGKLNIVVSGGTASGKTTTLNALSSFIPEDERIVTIEDAAELRLDKPHLVTLEARPANMEGKGEVTIRQLVVNALRMRPDRIVVGEVRSGEAFDMLQAMNTGHEGSLTTVHANSPRDALGRIDNLVLMAGFDLPVRLIREQIASAIDLVIHQQRFPDGVRRITNITEVLGTTGTTISMQEVFSFERDAIGERNRVSGHFTGSGLRPNCLDKLLQRGIDLPMSLFAKK